MTGRVGIGKSCFARDVALDADLQFSAIDCVDFDEADDLIGHVSTRLDAPGADFVLLDGVDRWHDAVASIRRSHPERRIIATALAPTGILGESVIQIRPLEVPLNGATVEAIRKSPAVRLFLERALASSGTFEPCEQTLDAVAELCRRLDGVPLLIELAASRTQMMSPRSLLTALESSSGTDVLGEALRRSLDCSYQLLDTEHARALGAMSFTKAPATIETVRCLANLSSTEQTADVISRLVELHLVSPAVDESVVPRFALSTVVREYAAATLDSPETRQSVARRHAARFADLARSAAVWFESPHRSEALRSLDIDYWDLVEAAEYLIRQDRCADALELTIDVLPLSLRRGENARWAAILGSLLTAPDLPHASRSTAMVWLGSLLGHAPLQADREEVGEHVRAGLELARDLTGVERALVLLAACSSIGLLVDPGEIVAVGRTGRALADEAGHRWLWCRFAILEAAALHQAGSAERAAALGTRALQLASDFEDDYLRLRAALVLHGLPTQHQSAPLALPPIESFLDSALELDDVEGSSYVAMALALRHLREGDHRGAARWIGSVLGAARRTRSAVVLGVGLLSLVVVAVVDGDHRQAARLHGACSRLSPLALRHVPPAAAAAYDASVAHLESEMGSASFDQHRRAGEVLPLSLALEEALSVAARMASATPRSEAAPAVRLTPREIGVLTLLAEGCSNKEIAARLDIKPKTVMHHNASIYRKLGVESRAGAVGVAIRHNLVAVEA